MDQIKLTAQLLRVENRVSTHESARITVEMVGNIDAHYVSARERPQVAFCRPASTAEQVKDLHACTK